jgi:transposase
VHCAVPRADCPEDGIQDRADALGGAPELALHRALRGPGPRVHGPLRDDRDGLRLPSQLRVSTSRVWRMLDRAVCRGQGQAADYSGVATGGVDDTARRRGQNYVSTMVDLDGQRVVAVTEGRDRGAVIGRLCDQLEAHGGDRAAVLEVTRDMSEAYSLGVAAEMPQAAQTVDRFHVMQLFSRATTGSGAARGGESEDKRAARRHQVRAGSSARRTSPSASAPTRESLDPARSHLQTARACQMAEAMRDVYEAARTGSRRRSPRQALSPG